MSTTFIERIAEYERRIPGYAAEWESLCEILLTYGGEVVVPHLRPNRLLSQIIQQGSVVPEEQQIEYIPGEDNNCHRNADALVQKGLATSFGHGYALSDDGLWREHSWAWGPKGHLIETTEPRDRYFGIRLD